ncbi:helix-turn-helix domain-containing protein [Actinomadura viridis]|uniref:Transcriptional regulator with XRE-family HTH domain n=1 Tax=Actinomadura viridis TaxID=58110 RepID=A0A931DHM4_9ACTN|nr:helix-turn-helix transcriptional regulator [Actinomadura viridis]MBG6086903.1 transcriptional regulator with XRE-family HTH domain [Actinomadura viridis]
MSDRSSPTVRARRLTHELRRLRDERGWTIDQVVQRSLGDFSSSALSRWENGERRIRPSDLNRLLDIYDVAPERRDVLLTLARQARERGWWHAYGTAVPTWFQVFVGLETEAASARAYESELVPGLLQTAEYYRAFLHAAPAAGDAEEIERKIEVRTARQERLTGDDPLMFWAVINEAVIRRPVGGPDIMREQVRHIADFAALPHVTVQVLPFRAGAHPAMASPFTVLEFPESYDHDVAYLENSAGALYLEEEHQVKRYDLMHRHLTAKALDPDESRALMLEAANDLR